MAEDRQTYQIHNDYCRIWKSAKSGKLVSLNYSEKATALLMTQHPEFQYFGELLYGITLESYAYGPAPWTY